MHFLKRRRLFGIRPHMHYLDAQPLSQRFKTHAGYIDFRLFAPAFRDGPVEYLFCDEFRVAEEEGAFNIPFVRSTDS